ncbi:uncharacterized protein SPPG_05723 [Spizellomyces punctatus DAOM BR117]|uniref:Presequence translocated-associated motor subunit PAM17 n=1 Tax=Spizellomyces punctatus (strain DAOM BR117) TaxID=645134 RepID=A0A0L0HDE4_SPIPD|nr:uncharacterized protein SPPG_05723 [Spizellomyces punctatus DAOM BR117]KNC98743.1 hypothetical protein SPPG_05723 [Spizellomyces punctatus DAOM BR117]|eukprot:XP_016606783.1 hypothetical protein SPPG_05723 [Spizellomyces punctatus DAOM BR117]
MLGLRSTYHLSTIHRTTILRMNPHTTRLASSSSNPTHAQPTIPWREYFSLRKSRKNWERAGAITGGTGGFLGGAYYFGTVAEFDPTQQILGMQDPTLVYVLGAMAVAGLASFTGIVGAGQLWRLLKKRETLKALDLRDREFFHRIQRHRPKEIASVVPIPGSQSGMPDYYGEKINSVADYRSWLKKQRRFRITHSKRLPA